MDFIAELIALLNNISFPAALTIIGGLFAFFNFLYKFFGKDKEWMKNDYEISSNISEIENKTKGLMSDLEQLKDNVKSGERVSTLEINNKIEIIKSDIINLNKDIDNLKQNVNHFNLKIDKLYDLIIDHFTDNKRG